MLHAAIVDLGQDAFDYAKKAIRRGDVGQGILGGLAGMFLNHGEPLVKRVVTQTAFRQQAPPPRAPAQDPWAMLGLNPATATEKDVRRVAAAMAKIYHPDSATDAISQEKIKEVNQAVDACLKQLRAKK